VRSAAEGRITLPHRFAPRSYQRALFEYFDAGGTRAAYVAHRRSGKDVTALNWIVRELWLTPGLEGYYVLPTYTQAKRVMWNGLTDQRRRMLDFIPSAIVRSRNENELRVVFVNGSQLSFVGSEQLDALMGTNPSRLVFSEYALQRPDAWDYLRPILTQNGGKVLFVTTPRGRNHAWQLYAHAERDPSWYAARLTVADTRRDAEGEDGQPVISEAAIDRERLEGMPENLVAQEFYCSFAEAVSGAVFGREVAAAEAEQRITAVPHDEGRPVVAAWDIGAGVTAITLAQVFATRVAIIDYVELTEGPSLQEAARRLAQKPYLIREHLMPHDFRQPEWTSERSRMGTARGLGMKVRVLPRVSVEEGIHAARLLLPRCWFDERQTRELIAALTAYKREWDEDTKVFTVKPRHDWASHGADSFRYLALGLRDGDHEDRLRRPYTARMACPPLGGRPGASRVSGIGMTTRFPP
jgi:phage terminase large subunit